jgi:hypothetical protein
MNAFKGTLGLVTAAVIVVVLLVAFPAYRWFFLISLGIGVAVWGILLLWHRSHPIEEKDVQDTKRPLGLS